MNVGDTTWYKGDEVMITSKPYTVYGGQFQDAVTVSGKKISMTTREQRDKDTQKSRDNWTTQQEGFNRLHSQSE